MLLKQGARQQYKVWWRQYANGWVIGGYAIMMGAMLMNIYAMSRGVKVQEVSIIEALSYMFVPVWSYICFKEKLTWRKIGAIGIIIFGIVLFFV
jgi:drug/metabolite transporter (DMT)-like permease